MLLLSLFSHITIITIQYHHHHHILPVCHLLVAVVVISLYIHVAFSCHGAMLAVFLRHHRKDRKEGYTGAWGKKRQRLGYAFFFAQLTTHHHNCLRHVINTHWILSFPTIAIVVILAVFAVFFFFLSRSYHYYCHQHHYIVIAFRHIGHSFFFATHIYCHSLLFILLLSLLAINIARRQKRHILHDITGILLHNIILTAFTYIQRCLPSRHHAGYCSCCFAATTPTMPSLPRN